ncbi:hypothetical protein [Polyangium spumosum]|uniref:Uncharacterized protein n=1 Tax=Polyangium spumosum TaxID=889282 RepID=A0A6N7PLX9_9BACT|nr:hypothetical protein [Polyangium spumosum]MRG92929.1 hypothetical protein [Polyangium spumosum]
MARRERSAEASARRIEPSATEAPACTQTGAWKEQARVGVEAALGRSRAGKTEGPAGADTGADAGAAAAEAAAAAAVTRSATHPAARRQRHEGDAAI